MIDISRVKTLKGGKRLTYYKQKFRLIRGFDNFYVRRKHCRLYGWCILTKEALDFLAMHIRGKKVIELCGGGGFLTYEMRRRRIDITLNDSETVETDHYQRAIQHAPIDIRMPAQAIDLNSYDVVVMSWIPYEETWGTDVLRNMKSGQILIVEGESEGGCCADDTFFKVLEKDFVMNVDISNALDSKSVRFFGINDYWYYYIKK